MVQLPARDHVNHLNILYAVHHFPPKFNGGAEWRTHRTASAMQKKGYRVHVVCIEEITFGKSNKVEVKDSYFGDLHVFRLFLQLAVRPDRLGYHYQNQPLGEVLSDLLEKTQTNLFHLFGGYLLNMNALRSAREKGVEAIVSLTDFWYFCPRIQMINSSGYVCTFPIEDWRCARCLGEEKRRFRWLGRFLPKTMKYYWQSKKKSRRDLHNRMGILIGELNQTKAIVSPSHFVRDAYIQLGVEPERLVYSRQGVDLSNFPVEPAIKKWTGILRIGYIGQITQIKGVHILVDAVNKLRNEPIQLNLYGDLSKNKKYVMKLQALVKGNPKITFAGLLDRQELPKVLENLDALVVPSLWYENSPNVIQEAFAMKTPVIASNMGGMAELIKNRENGLLFEAGDCDDLAEKFKELLREPALIEQMQKGIEPVKSVEMEMVELEEIYHRITGKAEGNAYRH